MDRSHWTYRLFVEEAEVYLPFLEQAMERAQAECDTLGDLFGRHGVPEKGRVLDVACGIGRHSVPLAQKGYRVTGVDISPLFVKKAREYAASAGVDVRLLAGDMREVERLLGSGVSFDALLSMFTSIGYYGLGGDISLFRQLRGLASPGAVLVVLTAHRDWLVREFQHEGLDRAGPYRALQRRTLDLETSTLRSDWEFYEGEGVNLSLRLKLETDHRVYSLHELKGLLQRAGWEYLAAFGSDRTEGFRLEELTFDSKTMWVVLRAGEQVSDEGQGE